MSITASEKHLLFASIRTVIWKYLTQKKHPDHKVAKNGLGKRTNHVLIYGSAFFVRVPLTKHCF